MASLETVRPETNSRVVLVMVPQFPPGTPEAAIARPPEGAQGRYEVTIVLGTPGRQTFWESVDVQRLIGRGESLLRVQPGTSMLRIAVGSPEEVDGLVYLLANPSGTLGAARLNVIATGFGDAEVGSHNIVQPLLSWLAFEYDVALEIAGYQIIESSTSSMRVRFGVLGREQIVTFPATEQAEPDFETTGEFRIALSAYREGLNATNPFFRVLCFFKVVEWITRRRSLRRAASGDARDNFAEPERMPENAQGLPPDPFGVGHEAFARYFGRSFGWVREDLRETMRNAIAHLNPEEEILIADRIEDEGRSERAAVVVKFVARRMLQNELALLGA